MKRWHKFLIGFLIGFLVFLSVMERAGWKRIIEALFLILSKKGLIIIFLTLVQAILSIFRWKIILRALGVKSDIKQITQVWSIGFAGTYLTPTYVAGGEFFKIYLGIKTLKLPFSKSAGSVAIDKILDGTLFLLFLIGGILTFFFLGDSLSKIIALTVLILVSGLAGFLFLVYFKSLKKESTLDLLFKIFGFPKEKIKRWKNGKVLLEVEDEVINFFSSNKNILWKGIGLSFLKQCTLLLRAIVLIFYLKEIFVPLKGLAVVGLMNFASFFPLPSGLGSLEAAGAFSFEGLDLGFASGTIFSMAWRAADFVLFLIGMLFLVKLGGNLLRIKILEYFDKINSKNENKQNY